MNHPHASATAPVVLAVLPLLLTGGGLEAAFDGPDASATTGWEEQPASSPRLPSCLPSLLPATTTQILAHVHHAVHWIAGVPRFSFPSRLANFAEFHSVTDAHVV